MTDFYITYHHGDEMAARWIAAEFKQARFTTLSDSWDFLRGETPLEKIDSMFRVSQSVMVLISRQFLESLGDSVFCYYNRSLSRFWPKKQKLSIHFLLIILD